jgi:hypothetical protein
MKLSLSLLVMSLFVGQSYAGDVEVVKTRFEYRNDSWYINTTLRHSDTGWRSC